MIAMVGAGQLARMTHQAAIGLGVELRVLAAAPDDPAVLAGAAHHIGDPADLEALRALAADAEVLTFDHERVPPEHLQALERSGVRVAPGAAAKLLAQDKLVARRTLAALGFPVPPFAHVTTHDELERFARRHGPEIVVKAVRGGYDGRGVRTLDIAGDGLGELPAGGLLAEPLLAVERELSVLLARSADGTTALYPVIETVQRDAMCRELRVPAPIPEADAVAAQRLATAIAEAIGATGVMAVELFVTAEGLVVNELALRPHNTGHWTIEGAETSQFEQHLRAVLGWPLGDASLRAGAVATVNVVGTEDGGDPATHLAHALATPGAHVHLYGKAPRPGRKLGHVTVCGEEPEVVRERALLAAARLEGRA